MSVTIFHNPRCSKSRQALELLRARGIDPHIVHYLADPPDRSTLEQLLKLLAMTPRELMRKSEAAYKELGLDQEHDDDALISAMLAHPILIERPIVRTAKGAVVGRPPEAVLKII